MGARSPIPPAAGDSGGAEQYRECDSHTRSPSPTNDSITDRFEIYRRYHSQATNDLCDESSALEHSHFELDGIGDDERLNCCIHMATEVARARPAKQKGTNQLRW